MGKLKRGKKKVNKFKLKNNQSLSNDEPEVLKYAPHSFVFHRGSVGESIMRLTLDFRKVMEPFTASSLKAMKANRMKDFLSVSGLLHVSHMCVFSSTDLGTYLKVIRTPRGPTLYFKILNYSLSKDVISSLKKQLIYQKQFLNPALLILNNFTGDEIHLKLMTSMFQNMFPTLNLINMNLNNVRRCALFNYNADTGEIDFRHYSIKVVPINISRGVKKIIQNKVPDLSKFNDAADFMTGAGILSESEAEDDPEHHITLPQKISTRGNLPLNQSSIRLIEQGPRMTLQLVKIEEGFLNGEVLYHRNLSKTEEEKAAILERRIEKRRLKEARKREQEERKRIKELAKQKLKEKSLEGQKANKQFQDKKSEVDSEDDADYYKKEVGVAPESHLFNNNVNNICDDNLKNKMKEKLASDCAEKKTKKIRTKQKSTCQKTKKKKKNLKF